jgi:hypothetical protein
VIIPQSLTLVDSARYLMAMPLIRNEIKANKSKLKDFATYRVSEPKDAPGTANHRDLGKLATDASELALRLLHYFTLSVVSTEDLTAQTWDSSGVYLNYYVLDNWLRR